MKEYRLMMLALHDRAEDECKTSSFHSADCACSMLKNFQHLISEVERLKKKVNSILDTYGVHKVSKDGETCYKPQYLHPNPVCICGLDDLYEVE